MFSFRVLRSWVRTRNRFALIGGTDVDGTIHRLESGIPVRGERAWLLICSCLLASIGLDTGSAAVIIGAMLISPLMSPILGVGLGTALADRSLLQFALRELALATAITLGVSALYFTVSPLAEPTAELISRTQPTLLEVGVALFGGIAGIVAGSRRDQSISLPGVAIATALMPPLCTAGFGLGTGHRPSSSVHCISTSSTPFLLRWPPSALRASSDFRCAVLRTKRRDGVKSDSSPPSPRSPSCPALASSTSPYRTCVNVGV